MPFDDSKYFLKGELKNGDLGGIALDMAIALDSINDALKKLDAASPANIKKEIASIEKSRRSLWTTFENLTGWTPQR